MDDKKNLRFFGKFFRVEKLEARSGKPEYSDSWIPASGFC